MSRTALVLGAGLGGLVAAENLRKLLPANDRVIAVEQGATHFFPPSLLWQMVGERAPADFTRAYDRLKRRGIEMRHAVVTHIDARRRTAEIGGVPLQSDALVIALGAEYAPETIPGLAEAGLSIYTPEGATAIHAALNAFAGGRIVFLTATPAYKCPAAPYEAALLAESYLCRRGVRDQAQIEFYAAEPQPMAVAGPVVGAAVRGMIEARGIVYHPEHQVVSVDASARRLAFANGETAEFDLLLYVPPHRAPAVVREAGLTNEAGWVPVDRHTLQTRFEGVFAIGDVTIIPLKMGRPLPKAGVFAHGQAEVVAANIAHAWTGKGTPRRFDGHGMCFIEAGGGRAGIGRGDFYAEPAPQVEIHGPSLLWHVGKVLYEKYWVYWRF